MNKFGRILLPFVTPFNSDESINYDKFAGLIDYAIKKGYADSVVVSGTTGEFNTLTFDERVKLFETAVNAAAGRKPVIAGTGCASTIETIALTKKAEKLGVDLCMVVAPYYCHPTQKGVIEHYRRVCEAVDTDILVYNIPLFVGINIEPATLAKIAEFKNIVGVKDESGLNPTQITEYDLVVKPIKPDFMIYNGDDIMLLPALSQGSVGIVSGSAMFMGDVIHKVFKDYEEGRVTMAIEGYRKVFAICKTFGINGRTHPNPMLKYAISLTTGIDVGNARGPLLPIDDEEKKAMEEALIKHGLI